MDEKLIGLRREYFGEVLDAIRLAHSPHEVLAQWIEEAREAGNSEPSAMCLSTVDSDCRPSSRFVLLRSVDPSRLVFFTNYLSQKGEHLSKNPHASVCFWWSELHRQVRVEGEVVKVTASESDDYFYSRPHGSQVASAASPQSQIISAREELEQKILDLQTEFPERVPRPEFWGGFALLPSRWEFWQGMPSRFHDRVQLLKSGDHWVASRLAP